MSKITLENRALTGKKAKSLKIDGKIPAVLYNNKGESTNVTALYSEIERTLRTATTSTIIDLNLEGKESKALIKSVDTNPINGILRHVEFFEIDANQEFDFEIPFEIEGISPAVKNNLGLLNQPTQSVLVRCKLGALVSAIKIDISGLDQPGQTIAIEDIKLPEGMRLVHEEDKSFAIVSIVEPEEEKVEEVVEAVTTEEVAEEETPAEETEA